MVDSIEVEKIETQTPESLFKLVHSLGTELYSKIKEMSLEKEIIIEINTNYPNPDDLCLNIEGSIDIGRIETYDKLISLLKKMKLENPTVSIFDSIKLENPNFTEIKDIANLVTGESTVFKQPSGEVLLIDFWATWCGPCQGPMQHNQEMLTKNSDSWKGKARIVAVAISCVKDEVVKRVEEKKWDKIEHYIALNEDLWQIYQFNGIPTVLLINKKGKIVFKGHPSDINLEEAINRLIEDKEITDMLDKSNNINEEEKVVYTTFENKTKAMEIIKKFQEENKELIEKASTFSCLAIVSKTFNENTVKNDSIRCTAYFTAKTIEKDQTLIKAFYEKSNDIEHKLKELGVSMTKRLYYKELVVVDKLESECSNCNKEIKVDEASYFCYDCYKENKSKYTYCTACIPEADKEDFNNPFHKHVLYFAPKAVKSDIVLQMPITSSSLFKTDSKDFCASCDNCGASIDDIRWRCANCNLYVTGSYDLCGSCGKINLDENHEGFSSIKSKNDEHKQKSHVLLRLRYFYKVVDVRYAEFKP